MMSSDESQRGVPSSSSGTTQQEPQQEPQQQQQSSSDGIINVQDPSDVREDILIDDPEAVVYPPDHEIESTPFPTTRRQQFCFDGQRTRCKICCAIMGCLAVMLVVLMIPILSTNNPEHFGTGLSITVVDDAQPQLSGSGGNAGYVPVGENANVIHPETPAPSSTQSSLPKRTTSAPTPKPTTKKKTTPAPTTKPTSHHHQAPPTKPTTEAAAAPTKAPAAAAPSAASAVVCSDDEMEQFKCFIPNVLLGKTLDGTRICRHGFTACVHPDDHQDGDICGPCDITTTTPGPTPTKPTPGPTPSKATTATRTAPPTSIQPTAPMHQAQGCLSDYFDNENMRSNNRLYKGQFICNGDADSMYESRYRFGVDIHGNVVWRDMKSNKLQLMFQNPYRKQLEENQHQHNKNNSSVKLKDTFYLQLQRNGHLVLHWVDYPHEEGNEDTIVWTAKPANHTHIELTEKCKPNHDCPYMHMSQKGILHVDWLSREDKDGDGKYDWEEKNFQTAYEFSHSYGST